MPEYTEAQLPPPLKAQAWFAGLEAALFGKKPPPPPKLPKLIGVTGRAGAGKDEIALYLQDTYGYRVERFSDGIKAGICAMLSLPHKIWEDRELKESPLTDYGKSPRELAQSLGTEWGRKLVGPGIWVTALLRRLGDKHTVVPDVRFDNEAAELHNLGALIIHVRRPGQKRIKGVHVSEKGINSRYVDVTVTNDSTIAALRVQIEAVLTSYNNAN